MAFIGLAIFLACSEGKYRGFKAFNSFIYYHLDEIGEVEDRLGDSTYIALDFKYCTTPACTDDQPFQTAYLNAHYAPEFWKNFSVGDEFTMILDSNKNMFWLSLLDLHNKKVIWPVIVKVEIYAAQGMDLNYQGEEDENFSLYREETEIALMKQECLKKGSPSFQPKSGLYISQEKKGEGNVVSEGKGVVLSYKSYFSNGIKFDDTSEWKDTLSFTFGQPFQVIEGIELGIEGLKEGAEVKLIIPSHLAFGEEGSSSGMVPPFEPLLYDLKIISVINEENEIQ